MIEFVFFDVGGVVIQDFSGTDKWEELLSELGITAATMEKFLEIWETSGKKRCTTFYVDDLLPILEKELSLQIPRNYSFLMGFVNRFEKNEAIWPILSQIRSKVSIGLLTNMYPRMLKEIESAGILPPVEWDIVVDSSIVKFEKPEREIYRFAEEQCKVRGENILFVDNTKGHLEVAAQEFGWQTFLFDSTDSERSSKELSLIMDASDFLTIE